MINLKKECDYISLSVDEFCIKIGVPYQTVYGWSKSRPELLNALFQGFHAINFVESYNQIVAGDYMVSSPLQAVKSFSGKEREAQ